MEEKKRKEREPPEPLKADIIYKDMSFTRKRKDEKS